MDARRFLDVTEEEGREHCHRLYLKAVRPADRAGENSAIDAEQRLVAVRLTQLPWPHGNVYLGTAS